MDLEQKAIERIKTASDMSLKLYKQPLVVCYSGGKDSDVLLHLFEVSGVSFEVLHSLTTADAPETVRHVYDTLRRLGEKGIRCSVDKHVHADGSRTTMWNLIPRKLMPPTRLVRYCCRDLKETGGRGRLIATGVRWGESAARAKGRGMFEVQNSDRKKSIILANDNDENRRMFETCQVKDKRVVNPIVDWADSHVLDYAQSERVEMNCLYNEGFKRVGCVGCPMAGKSRAKEFARYPKIKAAYLRAFEKMLDTRRAKGLPCEWATGEDVYHWWMEDGVMAGQEYLEGFGETDGI